jgi:hypothetical protein
MFSTFEVIVKAPRKRGSSFVFLETNLEKKWERSAVPERV